MEGRMGGFPPPFPAWISRSYGDNPGMTNGPTDLRATTMADLRRARALAPGGADYERLVLTFLPVVWGTAAFAIPENPALAEGVATAVFETFALKWRRIPKKSPVVAWLVRTAWLAADGERKRLGLPRRRDASASGAAQVLFRELWRLPARAIPVLLLGAVLGVPAADIARAARLKERKVEKLAGRGLAKLEKPLRKRKIAAEARALLASLVATVSPESERMILARLLNAPPKQPRSDLVRATLRAWQWVAWKRRVRRVLATIGGVVCFLAVLACVFVWLAQRGDLFAWMIGNSTRNMAKDARLTQPARPWPVTPADRALVSAKAPASSSELYGLTNIWISKFTFTPEQWNGITPARVERVPRMFDSRGIVLRNPASHRSGLAGVMGYDFQWTGARLDFADVTLPEVSARFRGNGTYIQSLYGHKQSFKIDLNKRVKGQSLGGVHTLNYVNMVPDYSCLHDALGEQFFRDLGVPGPRTAYSYLSVDVPGKFTNQAFGLYLLVENIDSDFASDRFGTKKTPIFKPVGYDLFNYLGEEWKPYADMYDIKTQAKPEQLGRLIDFARLVTKADDAEFARRLPEFLDMEEFAGFLGGHVLLSSYDGFLANGQNYYLYLHPQSGKFGFISWDQDHGWGEFGYIGTADKRERASIWRPSAYRNHFLDRVLKVPAFREIYRLKLEGALANLFTVSRINGQIDALAAIVRPAVAAENDFRLSRFDQAVSGKWLEGPRDGQPEGPDSPAHQMKRFVANRVKSVRAQLDGKEEGVILAP